ncbi:MAG TPA: glycosyltransferase [Anaeromyxobacteraceae bacterium]|nr:glycosyltransferase [Anaeromyxobacteraceae bacterium]
MIFAMTGTEVHPFPRFTRAIDELHRAGGLGEEVFLQLGNSPEEPRHVPFERFLSFGEVVERVRAASVVVTHAGAGSTLVCLQQGKHPVVVPRLHRLGEMIDDHQVPFAARMAAAGLVTLVEDVAGLAAAIAAARARTGPAAAVGRRGELTAWLEGFWRERAGRAARP